TYGHHLFTERCSCMMRAGHPAADGIEGPMPLDRFLAWPHISITVAETSIDRINLLLGEATGRRNVVASLPSFLVGAQLLASDTIVTVPNRLAHSFLGDERYVILPAPAEMAPFDYWVLWHERSRRDPATMWMVDLLTDSCAAADAP